MRLLYIQHAQIHRENPNIRKKDNGETTGNVQQHVYIFRWPFVTSCTIVMFSVRVRVCKRCTALRYTTRSFAIAEEQSELINLTENIN